MLKNNNLKFYEFFLKNHLNLDKVIFHLQYFIYYNKNIINKQIFVFLIKKIVISLIKLK